MLGSRSTVCSCLLNDFRYGQCLNRGMTYFKDVVFPEAEVLCAAAIFNKTYEEADEMLYPKI